MTAEQLAAIRTRCEAATPGPWEPGRQSPYTLRFAIHQAIATGVVHIRSWQRACICREARMEDCTFIVHARTDIPALLDEVERLRAALGAVEWIDWGYCPWCDFDDVLGHASDCQRQCALGLQP